MKIVTLNEIHRYIQNFMLYKMIYFSSHKFAFLNLRFSPFYEHFRQLRREICDEIKNKVHHVNQLIEADLMMYIHMTFSKKNHSTPLHSTPLHSTHSTELFKIFFSLLTLSTAFLQKASGPGKNFLYQIMISNNFLIFKKFYIVFKSLFFNDLKLFLSFHLIFLSETFKIILSH